MRLHSVKTTYRALGILAAVVLLLLGSLLFNIWTSGAQLGQTPYTQEVVTIGMVGTADAATVDYLVDLRCDGEDDDRQFQQALDMLPEQGGMIQVLYAGNYSFSALPARDIDNVIIEGIGRASHISRDGAGAVLTDSGRDNWLFVRLSTDAGGIDRSGADSYIVASWIDGVWTHEIGGGGGVTDHGALTGLGDDDHTQYLEDLVDDVAPTLGGDLDVDFRELIDVGRIEDLVRLSFQTSAYEEIATGAITIAQSWNRVDSEGQVGDDDLVTISGLDTMGEVIIIKANDPGRTITVKHDTGNIFLSTGQDYDLDDLSKSLLLIYTGTDWVDLGITGAGVDDHGALGGLGDDDHPQYSDDLDDAYELGSAVTVDVADIVWDLASSQDIHIQDDGTTRHTWNDSGQYVLSIDEDMYPDPILEISGEIDIDQAYGTGGKKPALGVYPDWIGTTSTTEGWLHAFEAIAENLSTIQGGDIDPVLRGAFVQALWGGPITGGTPDVTTDGLYGTSSQYGAISSGTVIDRVTNGLRFDATAGGVITNGSTVNDTIVGCVVNAVSFPTLLAGTYNAELVGLLATASGGGVGTQTAYGVYGRAQGAADNYAGYFTRNVGDTAPVVKILQDNAAGLGVCLELDQDDDNIPFINFAAAGDGATKHFETGSFLYYLDTRPIAEARIRISVDGTDYWIYLDEI